jgi:hypothetical protein
MPRVRKTASRLHLNDKALEDDLADFREAHYGAPEIGIVRAALREFIDRRLAAEADMRKRFEAARAVRLDAGRPNVRLIKQDD